MLIGDSPRIAGVMVTFVEGLIVSRLISVCEKPGPREGDYDRATFRRSDGLPGVRLQVATHLPAQ